MLERLAQAPRRMTAERGTRRGWRRGRAAVPRRGRRRSGAAPCGRRGRGRRLRSVLVRPPGPELDRIRADAWDADSGALVDPERRLRTGPRREPPDVAPRGGAARRARRGARGGRRSRSVTAPPLGGRHKAIVRPRPAHHRPRRRRSIGRHGACACGAARRPTVTRVVAARGHADPRARSTGTATLEGGSFVEAAPRARRARHVDPLQPGGRAGSCARCSPRSAWELLVVPLSRLHDPHRRPPRR